MAVNVTALKCPTCGGNFSVDEGMKQAFCPYCRSQVVITNENEHIYHNIDDARIKEAETDRMIKLKQLEMEEKNSINRKYLVVIWLASTAILLLIGIIGSSIGNEGMGTCLLLSMCVGMWGGIGLFLNKKKSATMVVAGPNEVVVTEDMLEAYGENFKSTEALFKSSGFRNVQLVPLNDLTVLGMKKNGQVEKVTINGKEGIEEGEVYSKDASVIITYHCKNPDSII